MESPNEDNHFCFGDGTELPRRYKESRSVRGSLLHNPKSLCPASIKPLPSMNQVALDWERGEDYSSDLALR